jgi:ferredoxin
MILNNPTPVLSYLYDYDSDAWAGAVKELLTSIHEVDRNATQIWFAFYPLDLLRALESAPEPEKLASQLLLEGNYYLKDQVDSSHAFLYGHRFWPQVKTAVIEFAQGAVPNRPLVDAIRDVAGRVAEQVKVDQSLLVGITAVAFMTVLQVGLDRFKAASGKIEISERAAKQTPEQVLKERAKDDSQGLLGFLKTVDKTWTVVFDENDSKSRYKAVNLQELASGAAAEDKQKWRSKDPRCLDGPIPVQCRSAACGTCWVGVLGGAEKLTDVQRLEAKSVKRFGYIDTDDPKPLIRLACQAQTTGAVSIVIPPWNGVFGKYLKEHCNSEEEVSV